MTAKIHVKIITNERKLIDNDYYAAVLPTPKGEITVLKGHQYLMTLLVPGIIKLKQEETDAEDGYEYVAVSSGFVDVSHDQIRIMADTAELSDEIDEQKAKAAAARAQTFLSEAYNDFTVEKAQFKIQKHLARLKATEYKKKKKTHP